MFDPLVVFRLLHFHDGCVKELGLFSSSIYLNSAISEFLTLPGFREHPHGFVVERHSVECPSNTDRVYDAMIYFHDEDYWFEYSIRLGVFGIREKAEERVRLFQNDNKQEIDTTLVVEFIVNTCVLNQLEWREGFTTEEDFQTD